MTQRQLWGWADANPKASPVERLDRAIRAYEQKFDTLPAYCFVHPATLTQLTGQLGCAVYGAPGMSRENFYFGMPGDTP